MPHELAASGPDGLHAWTESPGGVAHLLVARHRNLLFQQSLALSDPADYGYEGCTVNSLSWIGGRIVVVTTERATWLRVFHPESGAAGSLPLPHAWSIRHDLVFWIAYDPGILFTAALPALDPGIPLLFRGAPSSSRVLLRSPHPNTIEVAGDAVDLLQLPASPHPVPSVDLLELVMRRLCPAASPSESARLVIETAVYPFTRGAFWRTPWEPVPAWMPLYFHRHLLDSGRARDASALVAILDEFAAPLPSETPETGWQPGWSPREAVVELVLRYVRRHARTLAAACRAGGLPPGWWCLLFDPAPRSDVPGSRVDPSRYSPAMRRCFDALVRTRPASFPQVW